MHEDEPVRAVPRDRKLKEVVRQMKPFLTALIGYCVAASVAFADEPVQLQWLLNFDGAGADAAAKYYEPDPTVGERPPNMIQPGDLIPDPRVRPYYGSWDSGGIHILNNSGKLGFVTLADGRKVLELSGAEEAGDGLVFEHFLEGQPSRVLEAIVSVGEAPREQLARIISSNDWRMRPPGQIVALGIDQLGHAAVELRAPNAFDFYPVAEELDSMHRFVRDTRSIAADGQFHHVAVVYDHVQQTLYLYVDGKLARATPTQGDDHEFAMYRAIGLSGDAMTGRPIHGFSGRIDAVAESTFEGPFKTEYFQLTDVRDTDPAPAAFRAIELDVPLRVEELDRVPNRRTIVHEPAGWDEPTYHHGPLIAFFKGRCYVAWHAADRTELDPATGMIASSSDLEQWSAPSHLPGLPRNLFVQDDALYLWDAEGGIHVTRDGESWETPAERRHRFAGDIAAVGYRTDLGGHEPLTDPDTDAPVDPSSYLDARAMERGAGHPFVQLPDGRWLAPVSVRSSGSAADDQGAWLCAPVSASPIDPASWTGGLIDCSESPLPGDAAGWLGPDGVLHYVSRCGPRLWHASSADGGASWTPLLPQPDFPDAPSYKVFGALPDGATFYVGNPYPASRSQLVLSLSADGWRFDDSYLVRWERVTPRFPSPYKNFQPGYEGVSAAVHDGKLYVVYSVCRERIEVAVIELDALTRTDEAGRPRLAGAPGPHPGLSAPPESEDEGAAVDAEPDGVRPEWLLNFEEGSLSADGRYLPSQAAGEIAPQGDGIAAVNQSGQLKLLRSEGRGVLQVASRDGSGDGLLFEHRVEGRASRVLEAIVRPTAPQASEARLISLNDWDDRPPGQIRFFGIGAFGGAAGAVYQLPYARIEPTIGPFRPRSGPGHYYLRGADLVEPGEEFHHLALVHEADREALYIYVDGKLSKSLHFAAAANEFPIFRGIGLSVRAQYGGQGMGFDGLIDAVAESSFTGEFRTSYFQLLEGGDERPEAPAVDRKLTLNVPYQLATHPDDDGSHVSFFKAAKSRLPRLQTDTRTVFYPNSHRDLCYNHNVIAHWFKDRLYVSWHTGQRGEHSFYYGGFVTSSADFEHWSPRVWLPSTPRHMHATEDALTVWQFEHYSTTEDGIHWKTVPKDENNAELFNYLSNHHHARLSDGRLMTVDVGRPAVSREDDIAGYQAVVNFTSDPSGMSGWSNGRIDVSPCADVGEPAGYEGPDGALHYISRSGFHIFHAASYDRGQTWTPLLPQPDFPDNGSNKEFGVFPDGSIWYVGNPIFGDRRLVVLGISRDGWNFDEVYTIRDEEFTARFPAPFKAERPGYEYPSAYYHDGKLYIVYSWYREGVELSIVDVEQLGVLGRAEE